MNGGSSEYTGSNWRYAAICASDLGRTREGIPSILEEEVSGKENKVVKVTSDGSRTNRHPGLSNSEAVVGCDSRRQGEGGERGVSSQGKKKKTNEKKRHKGREKARDERPYVYWLRVDVVGESAGIARR